MTLSGKLNYYNNNNKKKQSIHVLKQVFCSTFGRIQVIIHYNIIRNK